jgi:tetratricopeptide (TPR) repeat protein
MELRIAEVTRQLEAAATNRAPLLIQRGNLHREHRDWSAAELDFRAAARESRDALPLLLGRARLEFDQGHPAEAESIYTQAIGHYPSSGDAYIGRAQSRLERHHIVEAIADFQAGLTNSGSHDPDDYIRLAQALAAQGRTNEALSWLDCGVKHSVRGEISLHSVALDFEWEQQNWRAALQRIDRIIPLASRKEGWLARRGEVLLQSGRPAEAHDSYVAALRAIDGLPPRLQQSPAVQGLIKKIRTALAAIPNS